MDLSTRISQFPLCCHSILSGGVALAPLETRHRSTLAEVKKPLIIPPPLSATGPVYIGISVITSIYPISEANDRAENEPITSSDFRDFTFANAVRLWGTQNPRFFEGTRVAREAAAVLAEAHAPTRAAAE
jgi:hypothetical protein